MAAISIPDDALAALGGEIRRARVERGLSQRAVARRASLAGFDITGVTVSNVESGDTPNPGIGTVLAIARALEVPVGHLLGEEPGPVPVALIPLLREAATLDPDDLARLIDIAQRLGSEDELSRPVTAREELARSRAEILANPALDAKARAALEEAFAIQDEAVARAQNPVTS